MGAVCRYLYPLCVFPYRLVRMDTDLCPCQRKKCYESWHRNPTEVLMEEVTVTIPRYALERAAYLIDLNDGPWSSNYRVLTPYLLDPKPDPSTPL